MTAEYHFSMQSDEQRGSRYPNILRAMLASDADALVMASNLEALFSADVVSIDKVDATNYAIPYPAGTNEVVRLAMRDALGHLYVQQLSDASIVGLNWESAATALITANIRIPASLSLATSINVDLTKQSQYV